MDHLPIFKGPSSPQSLPSPLPPPPARILYESCNASLRCWFLRFTPRDKNASHRQGTSGNPTSRYSHLALQSEIKPTKHGLATQHALPPADRPGYLKGVLGVVHVVLHALVDHALGLLLPPGAQHPPQVAPHGPHPGHHLLQLLRAGTWGDRAR